MSAFTEILTGIKENEWKDKIQLTECLLNMLNRIKNLEENDRQELAAFAGEQVRMLLTEIPGKSDFKEKDRCCDYGDRILALYPAIYPSKDMLPTEDLSRANALSRMMAEARPIRTAVQQIFEQKKIEDGDIDRLISLAGGASGEYEKGMLYVGLGEYKDRLNGLPDTAKEKLTGYLENELERYLRLSAPEEDVLNAWEVAADIAKYFKSEKICELLTQTTKAGHGNVSFYAVESLLELEAPVPKESIDALAADPVYADITYHTLKKKGMTSLFPAEYASPENLAKSDLIHWLIYPTELGKVPDEIAYIGEVKYLFRKESYYVFKFRTDSDTLGDDRKGKWLIGWSSEDGGTFSDFDLLSDYEKPTVPATLKNIKKHLIGR